MLKKILIVRFSSIGDIVLTSPIIRCVKQQITDAEVHFLTKLKYKELVDNNPYINKIYTIENSLKEIIHLLKGENYCFIIDLHNNLRTFSLKLSLHTKSSAFRKLNFKKWLLVNFKINLLPNIHIVDRYFKAVKQIGINNDNKGLDFFIHEYSDVSINNIVPFLNEKYIAFVIGGAHNTKILPSEKIIELCNLLNYPIVLLGGNLDYDRGSEVVKNIRNKNIINSCGILSLHQSAYIIKKSFIVISNDTGLMHIAAALKKTIVSFWGNTTPLFGMYPYNTESYIIENKTIKCRPCSKIGFKKCPRKHFNCMKTHNINKVAEIISNIAISKNSQ